MIKTFLATVANAFVGAVVSLAVTKLAETPGVMKSNPNDWTSTAIVGATVAASITLLFMFRRQVYDLSCFVIAWTLFRLFGTDIE